MCAICGCSSEAGVTIGDAVGSPSAFFDHGGGQGLGQAHGPGHDHDHSHAQGHAHGHSHGHGHDHSHTYGYPEGHSHSDERIAVAENRAAASIEPALRRRQPSRIARLELDLLAKNDRLAARNRGWFAERGILALNLIGSPGAGKTALLEATARRFAGEPRVSVLEGDQETDADASRIRAAGCRAVQINTGAGCHLDADMVARGLGALAPEAGSIVFMENVGNLVCPALFDLGERAKVVVLSVTEGEDKPLKYPHVFRAAEVLVLNKIDLLPHLSFDVERCLANARRIRPDLLIFEVAAGRGDRLDRWCHWLRSRIGTSASFV